MIVPRTHRHQATIELFLQLPDRLYSVTGERRLGETGHEHLGRTGISGYPGTHLSRASQTDGTLTILSGEATICQSCVLRISMRRS